MTTQELIAKYNPANARNLSKEDLAAMRNLTTEELKHLAEAYPNGPRHKAYLVLYDNNVEEGKQIYTLSTWQNLYNVRKFSNLKNLVPHTFRDLFNKPQVSRASVNVSNRPGALQGMSARKVIDLSAKEAAEELKKNTAAASANVTAGKDVQGTQIAPAAQLNDIKGQQAAGKGARKVATRTGGKGDMRAVKGNAAAAPVNVPAETLPADQEFSDPTLGEGGAEQGGQEGGGQ